MQLQSQMRRMASMLTARQRVRRLQTRFKAAGKEDSDEGVGEGIVAIYKGGEGPDSKYGGDGNDGDNTWGGDDGGDEGDKGDDNEGGSDKGDDGDDDNNEEEERVPVFTV